MKDTYYFSHDYNPTSDPKIQALIGEHGAAGYGIYWRIVEMLHEDNNHKLELKKYIYIALARQMSTHVEQIETIVDSCINVYELFFSDDMYFWSERVLRNIDKRVEISNKRSRAGKISAENRKNATHVEHMLTPVEQNPTKERKGKEIKEKENINIDKSKRFIEPTLDEIKNYCLERKNDVDANRFFDFYSSKGWMVGKNKMKDWKAAVRNWENSENYKNGNTKQQNNSSGFTRAGYDPNNGIGGGERLSDKKRPKVFSADNL